jgi:HK97 family phage prohead protease
VLEREFNLRDAEIGSDGRTLVLACVPFDSPALVDDGDGPYLESFKRGAFATVATAPNRVELRYAHRQEGAPYGFGIDLIEDPSHLIGRFRVAPSEAGDQILALVRDDQLNGVSIGFLAGRSDESMVNGQRRVERVKVKRLGEVSLTPSPAFRGAEVLAVREQSVSGAERERERLYWQRARLL